MTPTTLARQIKFEAGRTGFDLCGIAAAGAIPRGDYLRRWLDEGRAGTMAYLRRHVDSRVDLRAWLPWARSVIVVGLNYHQQPPAEVPAGAPDGPRGRVAMYAWGRDYHTVMRDRLRVLVERIHALHGDPFEARICVDTSAVVERELAAAAGIGWIGKNTMVLNAGLGSYFFLGALVTSLDLPLDPPQVDHCGSCTRCLDACPTSAFPAPYTMDARRCISYLTIEHRGEIDAALAARMGDWVFGCDVCQAVCPYNRDAPITATIELTGAPDVAFPPLEQLAKEDDGAWRARTAGRALDRAKPAMWRRNAEIALRNATEPTAKSRKVHPPGPGE